MEAHVAQSTYNEIVLKLDLQKMTRSKNFKTSRYTPILIILVKCKLHWGQIARKMTRSEAHIPVKGRHVDFSSWLRDCS